MKLHDPSPAAGSRRPTRRVGRGHGSGRGKTAGRGTKGQKARSGGTIPAWFEGGQTPLHVRTPKLHGFKNRFRVAYAAVNLARISGAARGTLVTPDVLVHDGVLANSKLPVKILGGGDAPAGITIHAHAFSRSALEKLERAGSQAQRISWPEGLPMDEPIASEPPATASKRTAEAQAPAATDETQEADVASDEAGAADAGVEADEGESEPRA